MAAYSHTQPLRNSRIKKLRHGIFDFGLRNYGIRSWGGAIESGFRFPIHTTRVCSACARRSPATYLPLPVQPLEHKVMPN